MKGYAPPFTAEYDFDSQPTFAVGEFQDGNAQKVSDWIDGTKLLGQPDPALKACPAFDYPGFYLLRDLINNEKYGSLPALHFTDGNQDALIALNKDKAVTFIENHDTASEKLPLLRGDYSVPDSVPKRKNDFSIRRKSFVIKCPRLESNQQPSASEADALSN